MDYDFSGLTEQQAWLILYQGWRVGQRYPDGSPWPQPTKRMVKKLIDRGLMTSTEVREPSSISGLSMSVTEYHVPIEVHMAWCIHSTERPA